MANYKGFNTTSSSKYYGPAFGPNNRRTVKNKSKNSLRKYPRPPKKGASFTVLQNWHRRCAEVDQFNRAKVAEMTQAARLQDAVYKRVDQIKAMGGKFNKRASSK